MIDDARMFLAESGFMEIEKIEEQDIAGIYAVTHKSKFIYIGESSQIRKRLASHDLRGWFGLPHVTLWCRGERTKHDRKHAERELIAFCAPLLNNTNDAVRIFAGLEAKGRPCEWARRKYL